MNPHDTTTQNAPRLDIIGTGPTNRRAMNKLASLNASALRAAERRETQRDRERFDIARMMSTNRAPGL